MNVKKDRIYKHVEYLTELYPARNHENIKSLEKAASYIEIEFSKPEWIVENQYFEVSGHEYRNVIASFNPEKDKRLIVGAHYDVCCDFPGADDNATGVAGLLECARLLDEYKPELDYRVDFVAFCLEEPPYFGTSEMGSAFHAKSLLATKQNVLGMICLDMIGCFSEKPGSQNFPMDELKSWFPGEGNFIIVAGRSYQAEFTSKISKLINRECTKAFPVIDPRLKELLELSDHRNYIDIGINAVMINDTAMLRNMNYHTEFDTIEKVDFDKMAEVIKGCYNAIICL
jgi:Zn-dependent M28 family amino/carboxypeptidase